MSNTNGIIYLMRGDSYSQPIEINLGTPFSPRYYYLGENDCLYFGLMHPNQAFENAVLKKKYTYLSDTDENGNILYDEEGNAQKETVQQIVTDATVVNGALELSVHADKS